METGPVSLPLPDHLDGIASQWDAPNDGRMDLHEIVCCLVGPIQPVGCSNEDAKRLKNIDSLTTLVDELLTDLQRAADFADSHEHSVKLIGKHAKEFMANDDAEALEIKLNAEREKLQAVRNTLSACYPFVDHLANCSIHETLAATGAGECGCGFPAIDRRICSELNGKTVAE